MLAGFLLFACGPFGPLPGGRLEGELAPPPGDWSFADAHWSIELETRPDDPYSVNLWCAVADGRLYVASGGGASSVWPGALLDDPRARLRVGDALYAVTATRVVDDAEIRLYLEALHAKYSLTTAQLSDFEPLSDPPASAILFRLDAAP